MVEEKLSFGSAEDDGVSAAQRQALRSPEPPWCPPAVAAISGPRPLATAWPTAAAELWQTDPTSHGLKHPVLSSGRCYCPPPTKPFNFASLLQPYCPQLS